MSTTVVPVTPTTPPRTHRGPLSAADLADVRGVIARAEAADGVAPLSEQFRLALESPDGMHLLSPHGYAGIVVAPSGEAAVEGVIDPEYRGNGEGALLIAAALGEARHAGSGSAPSLWAHGDLPGAAGLARNLGLERVRELLQLRRALPPAGAGALPLPPLPGRDDIVLRTYAGPSDDAEILRVNNAAFSWHPEQGGWTQRQIDDRTGSEWFDPAGLFLAFDAPADRGPSSLRHASFVGGSGGDGAGGDGTGDGKLLGFHWTKVHPAGEKGPEALGEVYVVGVDPDAQGRGLGSLLTLAGLHHLADRGLTEVELYVEGDNVAALSTYRRLGFTPYAIDAAYR
ncbi:mycothiol synthase [Gordonia sp. FQ]|uniref:mycothiol synthase n=1 Tax=Gordonia sp. FQ TaxID=3446634 RepID=UPI003F861EF3